MSEFISVILLELGTISLLNGVTGGFFDPVFIEIARLFFGFDKDKNKH